MRHAITRLENSMYDSALVATKLEKIDSMQRTVAMLESRLAELSGSSEAKFLQLDTTATTSMQQLSNMSTLLKQVSDALAACEQLIEQHETQIEKRVNTMYCRPSQSRPRVGRTCFDRSTHGPTLITTISTSSHYRHDSAGVVRSNRNS